MAVQKNKKSRSKRDMRRSHDFLTNKTLSTDKTSKESHIRHFITKKGFYKGKKVINQIKNVNVIKKHNK